VRQRPWRQIFTIDEASPRRPCAGPSEEPALAPPEPPHAA